MNWDDVKFVLAVARGQTLSAAARQLKVDQTTVGRRLAALEQAAGSKLFRRVDGRLVPTEAGEIVSTRAERVETEMLALEEQLAGADITPAGVVRLTATPILANRLLIPRLGPLLSKHPKLVVEIVAEPRNLSLTRRDADIAVRFARPEAGPMLCRKLGRIGFSIYAPAGHAATGHAPAGHAPAGHAPAALPWLTYEEQFSHLPQARWIARNTGTSEQAQLKVNDAESLYRATVAGLGRTVLPDFVAQDDARLVRLSPKPVVDREAWLLVHPDMRHLPRISVVVDWLIAVFAALEARSPDGTPCPGS